ncbi:AB hydrolase-1 domain-containing protein [Madurella fahalii]|uniref:AB hydrolase-1 domain-containing protein n=1 Tax=Madurella fahalii TaxID=1157608 RepID=A0ABQ0GT52_9PEZI
MSGILYPISLGVLALTGAAASAPTGSATTIKQCVQLEVPIPVVATNTHFIMPQVDSTTDAIDWAVNVTTWSTLEAERVVGPVPVDRTFRINAQLCVPSQKGAKAEILQIATHGLGFDKRYWDVEVKPEEYSYLDAAIRKGYSVLTYDRIGTGQSEKPDAYDIVQIPVEVEILAGLTQLARSGQLLSSSRVMSTTSGATTVHDFQPSKVVHVGHSFGSFLTAGMLGRYGNLSDGALLTGFLLNAKLGSVDVAHFDHEFAPEHDPVRFGEYSSGYFVLTTESCLQKLFFRKGGFEPDLLTYTEKIKQPETVGEYASQANSRSPPATEFRGPVQFLVGEFDYPTCDGDCRTLYDENLAQGMFPAASNIFPYLQPNTGHALTLASNASAGFEVMLQYLDSQGL